MIPKTDNVDCSSDLLFSSGFAYKRGCTYGVCMMRRSSSARIVELVPKTGYEAGGLHVHSVCMTRMAIFVSFQDRQPMRLGWSRFRPCDDDSKDLKFSDSIRL